ncbi:MAG: hypothetical protein LBO72_10820 [Helicobacteraceae bacterium]|jgi:uncharacterized membrane protein|nr:hypothetical protein [Helicobacteraceae bacterium]
MEFAAYFVYIIILVAIAFLIFRYVFLGRRFSGYHYAFVAAIFVALGIAVFALKNICEDAYLTTHFSYQFNTMLVVFLFVFGCVFGGLTCARFGETVDKFINLALAYLLIYALVAIANLIGIWFLYRIIKGLIYLIGGTQL